MEEEHVRTRIEMRVTLGRFIANMLRAAGSDKADVQESFASHLSDTTSITVAFSCVWTDR